MAENFMVCNCKQVSYNSIVDAIHSVKHFDDLTAAFGDVQKMTQCSTGCGGCHDKIMRIISDAMYGYDSETPGDCHA